MNISDPAELYRLYQAGMTARELDGTYQHYHGWAANLFRREGLPLNYGNTKRPKFTPPGAPLFVPHEDKRPFVPVKPYRVRLEQRDGAYYVYLIDAKGRRFTDGLLATEYERLACEEIEELR